MSNHEYHKLLQDALSEIKRLRHDRELLQQRLSEPVAIVGMACRFPGSVTPEQFWETSRDGIDQVRQVPKDRWDADAFFDPTPGLPGKMVTKEGGFLDDIRGFDAAFFGISPREARSMDPQQRLLLEICWEAIERAAIPADALYGAPVGVFLGLSNLEYAGLIRQLGEDQWIDSYFGTGNAASVAAGRIAYVFGFQGPTFTVDTACSSSLVAVHLAAASLRRRECDMAIAGGANLLILPETSVHFSNARMLSEDGRCKPFSSQANGYGRSEGVGAIVLKRLSDALRDRDPIEAVVLGSAINHDGRSAGLTAPNGPSQESVIRQALKEAGLQPSDVTLVEAHGTGTPLGDPIEAGALARVYGQTRSESDPLYVGTIKANIGHAEAAAGIAGLIHSCLCLKHAQVPPLLHWNSPSPHIPWTSLKFSQTCHDLPKHDRPLRAGVSSFGFSGTNAHVIVQEYRPTNTEGEQSYARSSLVHELDHWLILSAKSQDALRQQAERLIDWLKSHPTAVIEDVCFTLQVGRTHFAQRMALPANNLEQAIAQLRTWLDSTTLSSCSHPTIDHYLKDVASGNATDWSIAERARNRKRICLPTYAFQHTEYWIPEKNSIKPVSTEPSKPTELARELCTLTKSEGNILGDHQLFGAAVLPGVCWLELARQAVSNHGASNFRLESIQFLKMLVVQGTDNIEFEVRFAGNTLCECDFTISPASDTGPEEAEPYVTGKVAASNKRWMGGALSEHQSRCQTLFDVPSLYDQFDAMGLQYGPAFRHLNRLWCDENNALGKLCQDAERERARNPAMVDYGLLDSALHVVAGAARSSNFEANDATAFVPLNIESAEWFNTAYAPAWSFATVRESREAYAIEADVFVWNMLGEPMLQIFGFKFEGFSIPQKTGLNSQTLKLSAVTEEKSSDGLTAQQLLQLPSTERSLVLQNHLRRQLAQELEIPIEKLRPEQPLAELGLDSLMVFRLGIQMESEFGFTMDSRALLQGLSLRELTESLLWKLESLSSSTEPKATLA